MKLHELKEKMVKLINESNLPIDATYFVLKDILDAITTIYNNEVQKQENQKQEPNKKGEMK